MFYSSLKRLAKSIIPKNILYSIEPSLRYIWSIFYSGHKYNCNICNAQLSHFISFSNGELMCPRCGSLRRSRRLFILINKYLDTSSEVLHFSPERSLSSRLRKQLGDKYITSDFAGEFRADKHFDLRRTSEPDSKYGLIICYHVLEHIEEDAEAIHELYRILKPGGVCLVQTPFREGEILEDFSITTPEGRTEAFGQWDHVRVYSADGLAERLREAGFRVDIQAFPADGSDLGLIDGEKVLVATK